MGSGFEDDGAIRPDLVDRCYELAAIGYGEGGCPIGSLLVRGGAIIGEGWNRRVQQGDPIAHGEMDALRNAGRQPTYRDTILYTSLSPCMMCAGTIVQFKIPHVVVLENTTFGGNEGFLREHGVTVDVLDDPRAIALMRRFIAEQPALWNEDIAE
ncbi:nucleoside deaminase [Sphingomonas naphthae]|uniref:Nucleoside deaminase n=1 Tax=Sphingomonas naphthae TaxID=1813468 RepID=A0ABY7TNQ5_9SPHN|nr:nucleoside deaminase [Sphingomonas naphthae]WCT74868.1 nucleoside deaminase [Sphingomonas naphthae]